MTQGNCVGCYRPLPGWLVEFFAPGVGPYCPRCLETVVYQWALARLERQGVLL